ncbi:MAG: glycosyltransferase family 4 protein [bacterium]|nr:glycosyltransferase family 4 protein [bacterium]
MTHMPGDARQGQQPLRLLLIGTLPPPIGGGAVMLQHLAESLERREELRVTVLDTSGIRGSGIGGMLRFAGVVWRLFWRARQHDVLAMHVAPYALAIIGPVALLIARVLGKPLIVRKFGGATYRDFGFVHRHLGLWVARKADLYLVETKLLLREAKEDAIPRVDWFPNTRIMDDRSDQLERRPKPCCRFVFLSMLKATKGVKEVIAAAERLEAGSCVDVYGPFYDGISEADFAGLKRVRYRGVVPPEHVHEVLVQYDVLLLPTYYPGEGHPGILLEAYNAGLPVIATRWKAIPEIVDETCGILIEPRDPDALYETMRSLIDDPERFHRLQQGVEHKLPALDSRTWAEPFSEYCIALAEGRGIPASASGD